MALVDGAFRQRISSIEAECVGLDEELWRLRISDTPEPFQNEFNDPEVGPRSELFYFISTEMSLQISIHRPNLIAGEETEGSDRSALLARQVPGWEGRGTIT